MPQKWLGELPVKCEGCGGAFSDGYFYDAPSRQGPWGLLCVECWKAGKSGGRLGTGLGQKYKVADGEKVFS